MNYQQDFHYHWKEGCWVPHFNQFSIGQSVRCFFGWTFGWMYVFFGWTEKWLVGWMP